MRSARPRPVEESRVKGSPDSPQSHLPVEVVQAHLERIDAINSKLNAVVTMMEDAPERARAAEAAVMRGDHPVHARWANGADGPRPGAGPNSDEGLPIGVQVVGRHFDEATVLRVVAVR